MPQASMRTAVVMWASALALAACDEPRPPGTDAGAKATAAPKPTAAAQEGPKEVRDLIVDELGPFIGGERPKLAETGGPEKLKQLVSALPIKDQEEITLVILKKAKTPDVLAVFNELAGAGAKKIRLKTDGRNDLPKEIVVQPQGAVSDAPKCSVVVMVREDLSTAVWTLAGGIARAHSKGFAGPDLSHTSETIEKELPKCESSVAFFSADESVPWEHAHNLAGTLLGADKEKQIKTLVLLASPPVPGREVPL